MESGMMRSSQSNGGGGGQGGRLSMQSDSDEMGGRRSTNMYRGGGMISGGVPAEPLFDYHGGGEDLHMQKYTVREEEDDEGFLSTDEDDLLVGPGEGERRGLRSSTTNLGKLPR